MSHFALHFCSFNGKLFLERTSFSHPVTGDEHLTIRGKTPGAFHGYGNFQWTQAVQAMSTLLIRVKALEHAVLIGQAGSLAASLDYSISKTPNWISDMFGSDSHGTSIARRLFQRTNPERKRGGSVAVSWNTRMLPPEEIQIMIDGVWIESQRTLLAYADMLDTHLQSVSEQSALAA